MTTQEQKALELALEALETYHGYMEPLLTVFGGPRVPAEKSTTYKVEKAITVIKEALAVDKESLTTEAQQSNEQVEPVAWYIREKDVVTTDREFALANPEMCEPLCAPQQRKPLKESHKRKPLTHKQRLELLIKFKKHELQWDAPSVLIDMVEAAHGIKD